MTVAVAVARADDAGPRWRRRPAWRRGGYVVVAGRGGAGPAAAAAARAGAAGGRGDATAAASRPAHHAVAITGQRPAAEPRVEEVGAALEAAVLFTILLVPAVAVLLEMHQDPALGEELLTTTTPIQPVSILWSYARIQEESSSNIQTVHSDEDEDVELPHIHVLAVDRHHPEPQFREFEEPNVFENPHPQQSLEVNKMNDDLLVIFESLVLVRVTIHGLMCKVPLANDPQSLGKQIGGETIKANQLLKDATAKSREIEAKGGLPVPIPPHFYTGVKPVRLRQ